MQARPTWNESTARVATGVVLGAAVWLLFGWFVLGYPDAQRAVFADVVLGLALAAVSAFQLVDRPGHRASVVVVWLGLLLALAPVVLQHGYVEPVVAAYVNDIVVGLVVVVSGAVAARATSVRR